MVEDKKEANKKPVTLKEADYARKPEKRDLTEFWAKATEILERKTKIVSLKEASKEPDMPYDEFIKILETKQKEKKE